MLSIYIKENTDNLTTPIINDTAKAIVEAAWENEVPLCIMVGIAQAISMFNTTHVDDFGNRGVLAVSNNYIIKSNKKSGNINFDNLVGGVLSLDGINITSANNVNINNAVTTMHGSFSINNLGLLTLSPFADLNIYGGFIQNGTGNVIINSDISTVNNDIKFTGAVTLGDSVNLNTGTGAGDIIFDNTLDGNQSLTLSAGTGNINFNNIVGGTNAPAIIDIVMANNIAANSSFTADSILQQDGIGTTTFTGSVITNGNIDLNTHSLNFGNNVNSNGNTITFTADSMSLPTSTTALNSQVTLKAYSEETTIGIEDSSQILNFTDNNLDTIIAQNLIIGSSSNTGGIKIASDGNVSQNKNISFITNSTININGDINTTNDDINFSGAVTLGDTVYLNTAIGAGNIIFGSTLDSLVGENSILQINGNARFYGAVGSITPLNSLIVNGNAFIDGDITSILTQNYEKAVIIGSSVELEGSIISFAETLDSESGEHNQLTINGKTIFNNIVGGNDRLLSLVVKDNASVDNDVYVVDSLEFDDIALSNDAKFFGEDIHLEGKVDGSYNLICEGDVFINDLIGSTVPLNSFAAIGEFNINSNVYTQFHQYYGSLLAEAIDLEYVHNGFVLSSIFGLIHMDIATQTDISIFDVSKIFPEILEIKLKLKPEIIILD